MLDTQTKGMIEDFMMLACDVLNIDLPCLSFDGSNETASGYDEKRNLVFVDPKRNLNDPCIMIFFIACALRQKWVHDGLLKTFPNYHPAIVLNESVVESTQDDVNAFALAFMDAFFYPGWDSIGIRSILENEQIKNRYSVLYNGLKRMLFKGIPRKHVVFRGKY